MACTLLPLFKHAGMLPLKLQLRLRNPTGGEWGSECQFKAGAALPQGCEGTGPPGGRGV